MKTMEPLGANVGYVSNVIQMEFGKINMLTLDSMEIMDITLHPNCHY